MKKYTLFVNLLHCKKQKEKSKQLKRRRVLLMKKEYMEPIVELLDYATEDVVMVSFGQYNSDDFDVDNWMPRN